MKWNTIPRLAPLSIAINNDDLAPEQLLSLSRPIISRQQNMPCTATPKTHMSHSTNPTLQQFRHLWYCPRNSYPGYCTSLHCFISAFECLHPSFSNSMTVQYLRVAWPNLHIKARSFANEPKLTWPKLQSDKAWIFSKKKITRMWIDADMLIK